jgi:hypothetical protein
VTGNRFPGNILKMDVDGEMISWKDVYAKIPLWRSEKHSINQ